MPKPTNATKRDADTTDPGAFENGVISGRTAASELMQHSPLSPEQAAWLSGFLQGFLAAAPRVANPNDHMPVACIVPAPAPEAPASMAAPAATAATPYTARVSNAEALDVGGQPNWHSVALDVEEGRLEYSPCSTLALWPTNDPEEVRRVIRALGVSAQFTVTTERGNEPAWQVLLERVDINRTTRQTVKLLADYTRADSEARGLHDLAEGLADQQRSLLALLRRYPSARPPLERLLECLSPLKPSLVPIASSSLERSQPLLFTAQPESEAPHWGRVESRQRAKFRAGEWLTVSVDRVSYPAYPLHDDLEPILIIADGPGIAWARALVAERRARQAKGRTWVIATGMASLQFPFSRTLATWYASGSVGRFDVASGVEPADAVELLRRVEDQIWRWIVDHSRVLLVSTREPMREAIEHWFVALLAQRGHLDSESAHQRHRELVEQNRWAVLPSAPAVP